MTWVYPRACGGTVQISQRRLNTRRSIPARAGEPGRAQADRNADGSIPARAGEPPLVSCSGDHGLIRSIPARAGEPRAINVDSNHGSIPARAGEPVVAEMRGSPSKVYPRACGGTAHRMNRCGVYPRACGGTPATPSRAAACSGLSPRVRGNRNAMQRSIPARAGEPAYAVPWPTMPSCRVYPRACGGTAHRYGSGADPEGLSPRVRGNPLRISVCARWADHGSIPARAGEPGATVYRCPAHAKHLVGLSPRVRGNPLAN